MPSGKAAYEGDSRPRQLDKQLVRDLQQSISPGFPSSIARFEWRGFLGTRRQRVERMSLPVEHESHWRYHARR